MAILGLLLGTASPARAQSEPATAPVVVHRQRDGLVIAGGLIFGASYGAAVGLAMDTLFTASVAAECDDCPPRGWPQGVLLLPVAGPFLAWPKIEGDRGSRALWAAWSGVQAAGLAMM